MAENNFSALVQLIVDKAQARAALQRELKELQKEAQLETDVKINLSDVKQARKEIAQANREQQEGTRENIKLRAQELAHARMVAKETKVATDLEIANRQREMKLSNQAMSEELANRKRVAQEQKVATQEELASRESIRKLNEQTFKEESSARRQAIAEMKLQAQEQRAMKSSLQGQADKIQLSTDVTKLTTDYQKFGVVSQQVENNLKELRLAQEAVVNAKGTDRLATEIEKYDTALAKAKSSWKELSATQVSLNQRTSQMKSMQEWMRKNKNATKLVGDQVNKLIEECETCDSVRFNGIKREFDDLVVQAGKAGKLGNSLFGGLIDQGKKFVQWIGVTGLVMQGIQSLRQMKDAVIDVDSAMIELRKVSDASDNEIKNYFDEAAESAKRFGSSVSDMINATADWSRLGYNLPDSKQLAEVATLYKNVGDGIDIDAANQSLISTLQGFQLEAKDAMNIIDQFNEVANNFPIDSAGIGEALQRSAASLYAANTDLSKSIALITGTNAVVQDPSSVGNMWKTVSMRIRGTKQELEEAGEDVDGMVESTAQLRNLIKGLTGFDIMADEAGTQFKDVYDIVVGIGKEWNNLTDVEQAGLLETLAGKRQGNALSAALNNISMIEDAYNTATNSAGSALKEQQEYEKGIQYSLDRLTASAQTFANHFLDSSLVKGIVDFGNTTINVIDKITSALTPLGTIGLGAGLFAGSKLINVDYLKMPVCPLHI